MLSFSTLSGHTSGFCATSSMPSSVSDPVIVGAVGHAGTPSSFVMLDHASSVEDIVIDPGLYCVLDLSTSVKPSSPPARPLYRHDAQPVALTRIANGPIHNDAPVTASGIVPST